MKIFYVPKAPVGEFFYDPESCKGVGVNGRGELVCIGMQKGYRPTDMPGCLEVEVDEALFRDLRGPAPESHKALGAIRKVIDTSRESSSI